MLLYIPDEVRKYLHLELSLLHIIEKGNVFPIQVQHDKKVTVRTCLPYSSATTRQEIDLPKLLSQIEFRWPRMIEEGDEFSLQVKHIRAGGDR